MLPPDVEPIDRPRRGDGAGVALALMAALSGGVMGCGIGFVLGCAFGIRVGLFELMFGWIWR
ncbi:hypothetical protein CXZ10_05985 [Pleomorphomonas diazotrophica]|uniref:Uncharacterized protein n=1 Tax=Pleomorphomonas diazotrophica TaxID=1166257 RepID=A0A1I4Q6N8_9HYPH|nr:hypothetical protein [Pleomorphomonas diazotrophica]PKR90894.1 hypothetical protein CXZ10_05985 [Pleomorphomonas diazotrophica]SFM35768.1 hypothetical protein SAMN05192571_101114 [Pleomorphomonas diazotrophica]